MNFFAPIDALPLFKRLAASEQGARIRRSVEQLFPTRSRPDREAILRAYFRYRLLNRVIYRLTMLLPAVAGVLSRAIPVVGKSAMAAANGHHGPIIVASAHFGSLYLLSFAVTRALPGRRLYLLHKKGIADASRDEAFLRNRGIVPVAADERGLLTLVRALQDDPRTAIMLAFDPPLGSRHAVRFLGTRLPVATGVGLLADVGRCPVVPWFWQYDGIRPSLHVSDPIYADLRLPAQTRRLAVVEALYALLERRVAQAPEQWHLDFVPEAATPTSSTISIAL